MSDSRSIAFDIVLPTRNRCPYAPGSARAVENPLVWTLESLAADATAPIRQVLVVDDACTDHTAATLEAVAQFRRDLPLKHVRLDRRRGSARARNHGARVASAEWLLFTDDDCLFSAGALRRAATILQEIRLRDPRAVALNLPYYLRRRTPARRVPRSTIGVFEPRTGRICGNFDALPKEDRWSASTHREHDSLRPMRITNLGCTVLVERRAFLEVGGFPEHLPCENSYGEETELAARLVAAGHHLYFAPDPSAHVVHVKYGAELPHPPAEEDCALDFKILDQVCTHHELYRWSNHVRPGSGNRVDRAAFAYSRIVSYFSIVQARSRIGALMWLCRACGELVFATRSGIGAGLSPWQRAAVWVRAAGEGLRGMFRTQVPSSPGRFGRQPRS
jgi:GT2 family glycosyltransferase